MLVMNEWPSPTTPSLLRGSMAGGLQVRSVSHYLEIVLLHHFAQEQGCSILQERVPQAGNAAPQHTPVSH